MARNEGGVNIMRTSIMKICIYTAKKREANMHGPRRQNQTYYGLVWLPVFSVIVFRFGFFQFEMASKRYSEMSN